MSWKPAVQTSEPGVFNTNNLAFATEAEAYVSAQGLASRWLLVTDFRAQESDQPVNARIDSNGLTLLETTP